MAQDFVQEVPVGQMAQGTPFRACRGPPPPAQSQTPPKSRRIYTHIGMHCMMYGRKYVVDSMWYIVGGLGYEFRTQRGHHLDTRNGSFELQPILWLVGPYRMDIGLQRGIISWA